MQILADTRELPVASVSTVGSYNNHAGTKDAVVSVFLANFVPYILVVAAAELAIQAINGSAAAAS